MTWILIDCNHSAHRAYYAMSDLKNQAIYGVLRDIRFLQETLGANNVAFFFDGPKDRNVRNKLFPEYKANRLLKDGKENLYRQIENLYCHALPSIGYRNVFMEPGFEADDLIAQACHQLNEECIIVSTDSDLWQLISLKVTIWNPATKHQINKQAFIEEHDITPREWVYIKCLMGDKGDNIDGVDGVGQIIATRYLKTPESISHILKERIKKSEALIERNHKLIKLPYEGTPKLAFRDHCVTERRWNDTLKYYKMESLIDRMPLV